jgi:hypothetical protein
MRGIFPCDSRGHEHVCAYPIWIVEFAGDQVVFVVLNLVQLLGLISTFDPFWCFLHYQNSMIRLETERGV